MSCWHQHQQKTSRPRLRAKDGGASVSPIHLLLDLVSALFVSLCSCSLILWQPGRLVMFLWSRFLHSRVLVPAHFSVLQPILPFNPSHGRFPLPLYQSTTIPWTVTRVFFILSGHFELCYGTFKGLLPFPLPLHKHPWLQSPIPHLCHAKQAHAATQKGGELFIYLWGALLTTAPILLTPPAALAEQHRQVPRRVLALWMVQVTVPSLPGRGRFPSPVQLRAARRVPLVGELTGRNLGAECWSINKDEPQ